jgi:hypothetical protein
MASRKLFINYRRDDARADAGRLYDRLHARYPGRVFRDVGSLEPGVEWHEAIEKVLGASDACIVVVGREWLNAADASGKRRLDDPRDTVRNEVATALGHGMRVFPVLVGGAKMPAEDDLPEDLKALARRNALEISEQDWNEDFEKLANAIDKTLGWSPAKTKGGMNPIVAGAAAALVVLVALAAYFMLRNPAAPQPVVRQTGGTPPSASASAPAPTPAAATAPSGATVKPTAPAPQPNSYPPAPAPTPAKAAPPDPVGSWRTLVSQGGDTLNEFVELYPDSSFRVLLEGNRAIAGIGKWRTDADGNIIIANAVSFLTVGVRFSCRLEPAGDGFEGRCSDSARSNWDVAMTGSRPLSNPPQGLPRINIDSGTMAEKAAFIQAIANEACTCGCSLTVHNCLLKDQTCPLSPGVAQTQWATFLRLTRS